MSNTQRLPEIDDLIQDMIDLSLFQTNKSLPGRITEMDHATGKATIQLELKTKLSGVEVSRAPLQDVPIGFFRAGGFRITLPTKVGDKVWVFFADRSLDDWLDSGDETLPRFKRIHSLSDAFALPQAYSFNDPTPIDPNDAVIGLEDGSAEVRIKPSGEAVVKGASVKLGSDAATQPFILGTILNAFLTSFKTIFDSHTHIAAAPGAPTAVPIPLSPPLPNIQSSKIKGE